MSENFRFIRFCLGMIITLVMPLFAIAQESALVEQIVSVNGANRTYLSYVSTKANSFNGNWVVFALHDNGQSAKQFAEESGWMKVAEENSFAVVFPQAVNNTWTPVSGAEDTYMKTIFEHARTNLISRYPGDSAAPVGGNASGNEGRNNPIWAWEPLRDLTGVGAGAIVAQEFAMNHPGLFAAVATVNGVAFDAAYRVANEPAQNYFQHMRGKPVEPVWKQLKKEVPVTVWMFNTGTLNPAQTKQASYWKKSAAVGATSTQKNIGGFDTAVYKNAENDAQQFRLSTIAPSAKYNQAMTSAIWSDLFAHVVRWTSSPNGTLTSVMTEAEVNKNFEVKTIDTGDGKPYTYYLKLPSSYLRGQKLPLVISAHGANENAWLFTHKIKMHEVGDKEGFITVYPNGHKNRWDSNNPDSPDAKFIEMVVKEVVNTYGADQTRVYMHGFSNGNAMTTMMGVTRPYLFAAIAPSNGPGPFAKDVQKRVDEVKAKYDYLMPVMATYGNVDSGGSVDGKIVANGTSAAAAGPGVASSTGAHGGINALKKYNNITTPDRIEKFNSAYSAPYDVLIPGGKLVPQAIDKRYPAGRFQVYEYMSADKKPLNLLSVAWIMDMPHAYDLREAKMHWDYFKHWSRNADGSISYSAK